MWTAQDELRGGSSLNGFDHHHQQKKSRVPQSKIAKPWANLEPAISKNDEHEPTDHTDTYITCKYPLYTRLSLDLFLKKGSAAAKKSEGESLSPPPPLLHLEGGASK